MPLIKMRPVYLLAGFFLAFSACGPYLPSAPKAAMFALSALLTAVFGAACYKKSGGRIPRALILIFAASLGAASALAGSYYYYDIKRASASALAEKYPDGVEIEAIVIKNTYSASYCDEYEIRLLRAGDKKYNIKALLRTDYPSDFSDNSRFLLIALFDAPDSGNLYPSDLAKGIAVSASSGGEGYAYLGNGGSSLGYALSRLNSAASEKLKLWVEGEEGRFAASLALGGENGISDELGRDMRSLGLSHITAISGTHLAITLGMFDFILSRLRAGRRAANIALAASAILYMAFTGFSASVTRSALMCAIYYTALILGSFPDRLGSLLLSACVICLFSPEAALDAGLWLSFSSTLGLIAAGPALGNIINKKLAGAGLKMRALRYLISGLWSGSCALWFTLPFMWLYFGAISPLSPATTLIFSPPASLILYLVPLFFVFSGIAPLGATLAAIIKITAKLFISAASFFADFSPPALSLGYGFAKYAALAAAALLLFLAVRKAKPLIICVLPPLMFAAVFAVGLAVFNLSGNGGAEVYYYNYKLNDGIAVTEGGRLIICDISDGSRRVSAECLEAGRERFIDRVWVYMLTHYHRRYIATFSKLASRCFVEKLCLPEPITDDEREICASLTASAVNHGCEVTFYRRAEGEKIVLGEVTVTAFPYTLLSRSAHPAVCLGIEYGGKSLLYLGGAVYDPKSKNAVAADLYASEADVVIIGAHSPVIKSPFAVNTARAVDAVFASETQAGFASFAAGVRSSRLGSAHIAIGAAR